MNNCLYCQRNETQKELMIEICDLQVSTLFLFKEQSHKGRCVLAYKDHVNELFEVPEMEYTLYMQDLRKVGETLKKLFKPTKINFGAYSDTLKHTHWHIVPKYEGQFEFGGIFEMNPKKTYLTEKEYADMVEMIKVELKG
ncbi:MAG: HIT family protein [Culturomica sp.]|jgi:diadenosine tetraphosphate (Ap4A) HIT family hydrolase|nr:HIT family protein [Culturomica sp.]